MSKEEKPIRIEDPRTGKIRFVSPISGYVTQEEGGLVITKTRNWVDYLRKQGEIRYQVVNRRIFVHLGDLLKMRHRKKRAKAHKYFENLSGIVPKVE